MKKIYILINILIVPLLLSCSFINDISNEFSNDICRRHDSDTLECYIGYTDYFDTYISITFYVNNDINYQNYSKDIESIIINYNQLFDLYNDYHDENNNIINNISYINNHQGKTIKIDPILFDAIDYSIKNSDIVNGVFDISLSPVTSIWHDKRENCTTNTCELPKRFELLEANKFVGIEKIVLDETNHTIKIEDNMSIDLGGIAKGYLANKIVEYLDSQSIDGYILNAGSSNVAIGGRHPEGRKFTIGITDPKNPSNYFASISLDNGETIVTSGDYQNYYIVDNEIYHHIIDPNTLNPSRYSHSVSVIYDNGAVADFYSTSLFLMDIETGIDFVNSIDGLEAIWYGYDNNIYFSNNFENNYLIEIS